MSSGANVPMGHRLAPVLVTLVVLAAGLLLSRSSIVGLYHDDGIYAASAVSLSQRGTYALDNLPGAPPATKYPPLYSGLLAVATLFAPGPGVPLWWAKAISGIALAMLALVTWRWLSELPGSTTATCTIGALLVGLNPGLLSHVDLLLSDVVFAALSTMALWVVCRQAPPDRETRWAVGAGLLAGLAMTTRAPGVVVLATVLTYLAFTRRWRPVAACAASAALLVTPWWVWRASVQTTVSPLLEYYVAYEPQAWRYAVTDPTRLVRIVGANVQFFWATVGQVLGLPGTLLTVMGIGLAAIGGWSLRRSPTARVVALMVVLYIGALLGHPYPMARYLLPLVPLFWIVVVAGFPSPRRVVRVVTLLLLLTPSLVWLRAYAAMSPDAVHGGFGRVMVYPAGGFKETADWVRRCTLTDVRLASANDPYYFVATGRQSLRPWLHRPETYTPGYGSYLAVESPTQEVQTELEALKVAVLIRDPMLKDGEGEYARRSLEALVTQWPKRWTLAWRSHDGLHEVFVLGDGRQLVSERPDCAPALETLPP